MLVQGKKGKVLRPACRPGSVLFWKAPSLSEEEGVSRKQEGGGGGWGSVRFAVRVSEMGVLSQGEGIKKKRGVGMKKIKKNGSQPR